MPKSKTSVVLGATSALGIALARNLADSDACLILFARDENRLDQVASDLRARGAEVITHVADFDELESHENIANEISDADAVYFIYGTLPDQALCEQSWEETHKALSVNMLSSISLLGRVANEYENRGSGSLVVVSSVAGDRGRKSNYVYGTAKGALSIFCSGLRNRLAQSGVHVMTVKPGFIDTPMTAHIEKKPAILWVDADRVAADIIKAQKNQKDVLYTPWFWRFILLVIKIIPESLFKRLSL